jgi:type IV secretion system protein VirD4
VWDTDGGVYFGYATNATEESARPKIGKEQTRYVGDRHVMTIGPNGSGKSRRVLLPNLAQLKGWSVVVVDPKGDLCQMTRPRPNSRVTRGHLGSVDGEPGLHVEFEAAVRVYMLPNQRRQGAEVSGCKFSRPLWPRQHPL